VALQGCCKGVAVTEGLQIDAPVRSSAVNAGGATDVATFRPVKVKTFPNMRQQNSVLQAFSRVDERLYYGLSEK